MMLLHLVNAELFRTHSTKLKITAPATKAITGVNNMINKDI
jgi:hypothetical protein